MRKALNRVGLVLLTASMPNIAQAACSVADPTGTPLNVRDAPNGAIIGTLPNGFIVEPLEERRLGVKKWFRVAVDGSPRGWVFGAYVICERESEDGMKSAPMHPRVAPN